MLPLLTWLWERLLELPVNFILQNGAEFLGVGWEVLGFNICDVLSPVYQSPGQAVSKVCLELKYSSGLGWDFSP